MRNLFQALGGYMVAVLFSIMFFALPLQLAHAQAPSPAPGAAVVDAVNKANAAPVLSVGDALADVVMAVQQMGGLQGWLKIMCGILIFVAICKVSADGKVPLLSSIWPAFGKFGAILPLILSLIVGLVSLGSGGSISFAGVMTFLAAGGGGSIALHQLLDMIKEIPGLGSVYVSAINILEGALGGGDSAPK